MTDNGGTVIAETAVAVCDQAAASFVLHSASWHGTCVSKWELN